MPNNRKSTSQPSDGGAVGELVAIAKELKIDDLLSLQEQVDKLVASKLAHRSIAGDVYEELRRRLRNVTDENDRPKFTYKQLENFKPWKSVPEKKQQEFFVALRLATKFFTDLDFVDNGKLNDCILKLIANSEYLEGRLSLNETIAALRNMESIAKEGLPGWFEGPQLEMFRASLR